MGPSAVKGRLLAAQVLHLAPGQVGVSTATAVVLGVLWLGAVLCCLKAAIEDAIWSRRRSAIVASRLADMEEERKDDANGVAELRKRTLHLRQAAERLKVANDVKAAVIEKIRAGGEVSDLDVADLVVSTGAPVEVVFKALDEMSTTWHQKR